MTSIFPSHGHTNDEAIVRRLYARLIKAGSYE
jgi:hypothetical protein